MRSCAGISALVALIFSSAVTLVLVAGPSWADGNGTCPPADPNCVTVGAGSPGSPGGGSSVPPGEAGGTQADPCVVDPNSSACAAENAARMCSTLAADWAVGGGAGKGRDLNNLTPVLLADLNKDLAMSNCPPWGAGGTVVDTATLAVQAAASFRLPDPSGDRSPSPSQLYNGYPFTYLNLWTFYWTDPGAWVNCGGACTATARAGGNYATVTARPVSLTFDPGNGSPAVSCPGPGRPWVESDGNNAPTGGACAYKYAHVTGPGYDQPVTSTQTITWELTWVGSNNTAGTLTQRTTARNGPLNVLQIQTVNR